MPWRGVILGLVLALWVAAFTYFNDAVTRQPLMTGNLMPTSVYGLLVVLTLLSGGVALLRSGGRPLLGRADLAVMVVLATAAACWPGSNFFRPFVGTVGHPANLAKAQPTWRHQAVFSYLPGGSPRIAAGQVRDWRELAGALIAADPGESTPLGELAARLDGPARRAAEALAAAPADRPLTAEQYRPLLRRLNRWITQARLFEIKAFAALLGEIDGAEKQDLAGLSRAQAGRLNRALLVAALDELIDPVPPGAGAVLAGGQDVPELTGPLETGAPRAEGYDPAVVPWSAWWPVLRLWGGVALCIALASVCLAVIVHPQWSRHEILPYPLVRFIAELTRPDPLKPGRPALLSNRLFWLGLGCVAALHLSNGLSQWFMLLPEIPLRFDFSPLQTLFPNAANKYGSSELFHPTLFLSVVAFAFFIRGDVSFSMGIAGIVWVALLALAAGRGVALGNNYLEPEAGSLLRAGAYLGFTGMILYLGRRHYGRVAAAAIGLRRLEPGSRALLWAARLLPLCVAGAVAILGIYADLPWWLGLAAVLITLMILMVIARISAETGAFYIDPSWMPLVIFTAVLGFEGMGPEHFIVLALFSTVVIGNPREALSAYVVNGLAAAGRIGRVRVGRAAWSMAGVAVAAFGVAAVATLTIAYTRGLSQHDVWATRWHPSLAFDALARRLAEAEGLGRLDALRHTTWSPDGGALAWLGAGLVLVVGCAIARLHLHRWPIHPVLLLVLGSAPGVRFAWSFLLGWAIRQGVIRLGGAKAFGQSLPLAVGVIAGELLAAFFWQVVGLAYYFLTGEVPRTYDILPN